MASNTFVVLPAPSGNGTGASIDVSAMGAEKTITVGSSGGQYEPNVLVEISQDDVDYSPLTQFQGRDQRTLFIACRYMRQTVTRFIDGTNPSVGVGAPTVTENGYTPMDVPVGNGNGTALDSSALLAMKTVQVTGAFSGTINVDVSDDAGVTYTTIMSFAPGGAPFVTKTFTADHMRIGRGGVHAPAGLPTIIVADSVPGTDGGGGGGGGNNFTSVASIDEDFEDLGLIITGYVDASGSPPSFSAQVDGNVETGSYVGVGYEAGGFGIIAAVAGFARGEESVGGIAQWYAFNGQGFFDPTTNTAPLTVEFRFTFGYALNASHVCQFGLYDTNTTNPPLFPKPYIPSWDGLFFEFNPDAHSGSMHWWVNGVDTGVAAQCVSLGGEWQRLVIVVDETGTTATFSINDVIVGTMPVSPTAFYGVGLGTTAASNSNNPCGGSTDWLIVDWPIDRS